MRSTGTTAGKFPSCDLSSLLHGLRRALLSSCHDSPSLTLSWGLILNFSALNYRFATKKSLYALTLFPGVEFQVCAPHSSLFGFQHLRGGAESRLQVTNSGFTSLLSLPSRKRAVRESAYVCRYSFTGQTFTETLRRATQAPERYGRTWKTEDTLHTGLGSSLGAGWTVVIRTRSLPSGSLYSSREDTTKKHRHVIHGVCTRHTHMMYIIIMYTHTCITDITHVSMRAMHCGYYVARMGLRAT